MICIYLPSNFNSKIIKLPQSFGPINSKIYRKITSISLNKCSLIFSRGTSSFNILSEMGVKSIESLDLGLLDLDDLNTTNSEKGTVGIVPSIIVKINTKIIKIMLLKFMNLLKITKTQTLLFLIILIVKNLTISLTIC